MKSSEKGTHSPLWSPPPPGRGGGTVNSKQERRESLISSTADDSGPMSGDNFIGGIKLSYEVFTIQPLMRNLLTVTGQEEGFLSGAQDGH